MPQSKERELIAAALAKNESMQTLVNLNDTRVNQMIDVAWKEEIEEGKEVGSVIWRSCANCLREVICNEPILTEG